mmetsp:Transcript_26240/g.75134  ORF Transcript_26240/g.75134 Transcript_26240/m.75134 type:complete len:130 (-) Transcript_26240:672-1061(-)
MPLGAPISSSLMQWLALSGATLCSRLLGTFALWSPRIDLVTSSRVPHLIAPGVSGESCKAAGTLHRPRRRPDSALRPDALADLIRDVIKTLFALSPARLPSEVSPAGPTCRAAKASSSVQGFPACRGPP